MNARRFVDTNILLYAISTAAEERSKAEIALALLESDDLALSVQVLQEFYVQATRPAKPDRISHEQASALIESWLRFPVQETTVGLMQVAMQSRQKYPFVLLGRLDHRGCPHAGLPYGNFRRPVARSGLWRDRSSESISHLSH